MTTHQATDKRPGFFMIENAVVDHLNLSPHTGWLYCCIVRHVNQQAGIAFPSISTLSNKSGMSKGTVINHMKKLEALGLIRVERSKKEDGSNASNHYYLENVRGVVQEMNQGSAGDEPGVVQEMNHNKTNDNKTKDSPPAAENEPPTPIPLTNGGADGPVAEPELPSWWRDYHTTVVVTCLDKGSVKTRNRVINHHNRVVSELTAQGYLEPANPQAFSPQSRLTEKGRALAKMPEIAEKLVERRERKLAPLSPPKGTSKKTKREAAEPPSEVRDIIEAIMRVWLRQEIGEFASVINNKNLVRVANILRRAGHTAQDVVWYRTEWLPQQGDWKTNATYNVMVGNGHNMDAAKATRVATVPRLTISEDNFKE